jgi:hypothetical protein
LTVSSQTRIIAFLDIFFSLILQFRSMIDGKVGSKPATWPAQPKTKLCFVDMAHRPAYIFLMFGSMIFEIK